MISLFLEYFSTRVPLSLPPVRFSQFSVGLFLILGVVISGCKTEDILPGANKRGGSGGGGGGGGMSNRGPGGCSTCKPNSGQTENVDSRFLNMSDAAENNGRGESPTFQDGSNLPPADSSGSHGEGTQRPQGLRSLEGINPDVARRNVTIKFCEKCFNSPNSGLLFHDRAVMPLLIASLRKAGIEPILDNSGEPGQLDMSFNGARIYSRFFREGSKAKSLGYDERDDERTSSPEFISQFVQERINQIDPK